MVWTERDINKALGWFTVLFGVMALTKGVITLYKEAKFDRKRLKS